jgi:hypothetical protein
MIPNHSHSQPRCNNLPETLEQAKGAAQSLFRRLAAVEKSQSAPGQNSDFDLKDKTLVNDVRHYIAAVERVCRHSQFDVSRATPILRGINILQTRDQSGFSLTESLNALEESDLSFFEKGAAACQVIGALTCISMQVQLAVKPAQATEVPFEIQRELAELANQITGALRVDAESIAMHLRVSQSVRRVIDEVLMSVLSGATNLPPERIDQMTELRALTLTMEQVCSSNEPQREIVGAIATRLRRGLMESIGRFE